MKNSRTRGRQAYAFRVSKPNLFSTATTALILVMAGCGSEPPDDNAYFEIIPEEERSEKDPSGIDYADIRSALHEAEVLVAPDDPRLQVPHQGFALLSMGGGIFCPQGYGFDTKLSVCSNGKEALGPFPRAMVELCELYGGGDACKNDNWALSFAANLRGDQSCLRGTERDEESGLCSDGVHVYGPFCGNRSKLVKN